MGFAESISTCMGKYATFKGRATRSEYWWFYFYSRLALDIEIDIDITIYKSKTAQALSKRI